MKSLYKKFKELTGFRYADIARKLDVTRQAVDLQFRNYSQVYVNANKWIMTEMVNEKISEHKKQIEKLLEFKDEIRNFK